MKRRMVLNLLSCKDLKTENRALSINLESVGSVSGSQFRASLWAAGAVGEFKQSGSVRLSTCSPAKRFQSFFFKQGYLYHCAHESTHIKTQNDLKCCEEQAKKASYITLTTKKCWPIKSLQTMTSKKVSDHLHVGWISAFSDLKRIYVNDVTCETVRVQGLHPLKELAYSKILHYANICSTGYF